MGYSRARDTNVLNTFTTSDEWLRDPMIKFKMKRRGTLMNKRRIIFWGIVLLFGLMLTGCAGYYGGYGHSDQFPYNYTPGVGPGGVGGGY